MVALTCFALKDELDGHTVVGLHEYLREEEAPTATSGPISGPNFTAQVWLRERPPHLPRWVGFLQEGAPGMPVPSIASASGLVVVAVEASPVHHFAFTFGVGGRFLLRDDGFDRGFGLRVALNLIFPKGLEDEETSRLLGFDSKRRSGERIRERHQAALATTFEVLDVDRFRDVISAATGKPLDETSWGQRVNGADALAIDVDLEFSELGDLCLRILEQRGKRDYLERFPWLANMSPVTEPLLVASLEERVVQLLLGLDDGIEIAPPAVVDWERIARFVYHFDARFGIKHVELRVGDYINGLPVHLKEETNVARLRSRWVAALDGDGSELHRWSVWNCLFGELEFEGTQFVLDDGEFFAVSDRFQQEVQDFVDGLASDSIPFPSADARMAEDLYNKTAVDALGPSALLMDRKTVRVPGQTTGVELCDVLTENKQLVHVKRHLSSKLLSHLFSQGFVSATLLQGDADFRRLATAAIRGESDDERFDLIAEAGINAQEWEVVFAIVASFGDKTVAKALPFFSRINLMRCAQDLQRIGFSVSVQGIPTS